LDDYFSWFSSKELFRKMDNYWQEKTGSNKFVDIGFYYGGGDSRELVGLFVEKDPDEIDQLLTLQSPSKIYGGLIYDPYSGSEKLRPAYKEELTTVESLINSDPLISMMTSEALEEVLRVRINPKSKRVSIA